MSGLLRILGLAAVLLTLGACNGGGGGGGNAAPANKPLFSLWTSTDGNYVMSLDGGSFGTTLPYTELDFIYGTTCRSTIEIRGTEESGEYHQTGFSGECYLRYEDGSIFYILTSTDSAYGRFSKSNTQLNLTLTDIVGGFNWSGQLNASYR